MHSFAQITWFVVYVLAVNQPCAGITVGASLPEQLLLCLPPCQQVPQPDARQLLGLVLQPLLLGHCASVATAALSSLQV